MCDLLILQSKQQTQFFYLKVKNHGRNRSSDGTPARKN